MASSRPRPAQKDEAFPTRQITVLALCRISEPIAFTSILAYTYVMVQDLNHDETNASFYSGLLVSAFAVAEAATAMLWGSVSDKYGRKPVVLMGLAGTAISSLIFGFATKYWVALVARLVGGLLNGNVAVMQTMVAEMVKNPAHEPRAYAVQPFMWSLGSIIGSAMGGFLAQPARYYPSLFSADGLFGKFPYLLPNLVAALVIFAAITQGYFLLEETNPKFVPREEQSEEEEDAVADESTPLQGRVRRLSAVENFSMGGRRPSFLAGSQPTANEPCFDLRKTSVGTIHSIKFRPTRGRTQEPGHLLLPDDPEQPPKAFTHSVIMLVVALIIMCYHQMAFYSILPIYLLDEPEKHTGLDFHGGMGYTVHDVGIYMSVNGLISLVIQAVIFPIFVSKVGVWKSFFVLTIFYPVAYIVIPFLSLLPKGAVGVGIYAVLALSNFFAIVIYPCALILLKNATPSFLVLGKVNGLAMSACSGARTVAPPLAGIIYSAAGSAAAWWSCSAFAVLAIIQLYWVPREREDNVVLENALSRKSTREVLTDFPEEE